MTPIEAALAKVRELRKAERAPRVEWAISSDGGESMRIEFSSATFARGWLRDKKQRGLHTVCEVVRKEYWPRVSDSWDLAGRAWTESCAKGKWCMVSGPRDNGQPWWQCAIHTHSTGAIILGAKAETGPLAIALVIAAALPEPEGKR